MHIEHNRTATSRVLIGALAALVAIVAYVADSFAGLMLAGLILAILLVLMVGGSVRRAIGAPVAPPPAGPARALHIGLALLIFFGGAPLLGLPGLLVYYVADPFVQLVFGLGAFERLPMYGGIGIGMMVTWAWPWCLPVAYGVYVRARHAGQPRALLAYAGVLYGWAVVVSLGAMAIGLGGR